MAKLFLLCRAGTMNNGCSSVLVQRLCSVKAGVAGDDDGMKDSALCTAEQAGRECTVLLGLGQK